MVMETNVAFPAGTGQASAGELIIAPRGEIVPVDEQLKVTRKRRQARTAFSMFIAGMGSSHFLRPDDQGNLVLTVA